MAILSNINGKFAVDSTGAIQFSGAAGTSGYVLKSTGSGTAPTWVDPSTVIGGPYLPLTGGTLTGSTSTASGIAFTVGGILTTDKILIVKGQNLAHVASSIIISQESTTKSQIRFYGADTSTAGILEFTGSSSDGSVGGVRLTLNADGSSTFTGDVQAPGIYVGATNASFDFYNNGTSYFNGAVTVDAAFTQSGGAASTFSGLVSGITPTAAANFTTKAYVDALTPGAGVYLPLAGGTMANTNKVANMNADLLDDLNSVQYLPRSHYMTTPNTGFLVGTDIVDTDYGMWYATIKLEGFNDAIIQVINMGGTILNTGAFTGVDAVSYEPITIKIFNYTGKLYFWIPSVNTYTDCNIFVNLGAGYQGSNPTYNRVTSISSAAVPGSGVTNNTDVVAATLNPQDIDLWNANGNDIYSANTGNVGIGTANPTNALSVEKTVASDWLAEFKQGHSTAGQSYGVQIFGGTNASDMALTIGNQAGTSLFDVRGDGLATFAGGVNITGTNNTTSTLTLTNTAPTPDNSWSLVPQYNSQDLQLLEDASMRVTFQSGGNVGIGTDSPSSKLVVRTSTDHNFEVEETGGELRLSALNNARSANIGLQFAASEFNFLTGNVGIGTTSPSARFQVQQDQAAESNVIFMNNSTSAGAAIRLTLNVGNPAGNDPMISFNIGDGGFDWTMGVDNSDSDKFKISGGTDSHNPSLGTNDRLTIDSSGNLTMSGDVVAYSDKKLKKNIKTLDGSKVYEMRGVSFDRIDTGKKSSGVIAQEIQKIAPELISESNETLGVAYGNLTGYLIEAIKELKAEIEELKSKPCNCK